MKEENRKQYDNQEQRLDFIRQIVVNDNKSDKWGGRVADAFSA